MFLRELFDEKKIKEGDLIPYPAGTVKVDVTDVYDWYKLGQRISNLDNTKSSDFGNGPPQTVMAFGNEEEEHKYFKKLKKLGLKTHDIDPPGYHDIDENFADGKNPQDKGDSARHGIPKHASLKSLDKIAHQGGRKGQLAHWQANMRRGRMKEDASQERNLMTAFEDFLPIVMQELELTKLPKIKLEKKIKDSHQPTFGVFKEHENLIHLGIDGRHPLDILRTLAHELVHFKQGTEHQLDSPDSGATGSPQENQANARAGVIMRHFNKKFPHYFDVDALNLQEEATAGGTSAGNIAVGPVYKNKPGKSMKNKNGTVKNALDMPNNLLTGGSLKR